MLDLLIIGHSVRDTIYDPVYQNPFSQWGGIHNVQRSFNKITKGKLTSKVEPAAVGEATIFIDRENSTKEVYAEINKIERRPKIVPAKWVHICYQNELECLFEYQNFEGIVSVDWCGGRTGVLPKNTQYLFLSSEEFNAHQESRFSPKTVVIEHCPKGINLWTNGGLQFSKKIEPLQNVNPLGAGDHFAAAFICAKLADVWDVEAINFALDNTQAWLVSK